VKNAKRLATRAVEVGLSKEENGTPVALEALASHAQRLMPAIGSVNDLESPTVAAKWAFNAALALARDIRLDLQSPESLGKHPGQSTDHLLCFGDFQSVLRSGRRTTRPPRSSTVTVRSQ
jgi:hypothetical protein